MSADPKGSSRVRIGTRGSTLARVQTDYVKSLIGSNHPHLTIDIKVISTRGDQILDKPLPAIGGKGLFTEELEAALLSRRIDVCVHSIKDVPTELAAGLVIRAVPPRVNPADVIVSRGGHSVETLPKNAVIGTSSLRRAAQMLLARPDLRISDIRGNVDTRIRKALDPEGPYDAVLLAHAGLQRIGRLDVVTEVISFDVMLPAPGQGALGIQCRDEAASVAVIEPINHLPSELAATAERAFLSGLGGGCSLPISALANFESGNLVVRGRVTARDGSKQIEVTASAQCDEVSEAGTIGVRLAEEALSKGAGELLKEP
jgi:hydroxymethylbilane synthase